MSNATAPGRQRVVGYARVSSKEQSENSHALEQQIDRLKAAGATEIHSDEESGWKDRSRYGLEKVLELVRSRSCDEVVITRLDRLGRKGVTSFTIFDDFLQSGVTLRALDEPFDLTTASGRMIAGQLVVFAQFHSDQKAESVRHGWKHLRDRRVAMNPPFGYIKINDRHELDHNPFLCLLETKEVKSRAQIAREIVVAYLQQKSLRMALRVINERYGIQVFAHHNRVGSKLGGRIAREMFRFSPTGLQNWLTNPVLQGHTCYLRNKQGKRQTKSDWDIKYETHPDQRLISDDEAREIDSIVQHNRRVRGFGSTALKYPLSGLVFCAECRSACYSMKGSRGRNMPGYNYYFQCKNWRTRGCSQKSVVRMETAEQAVVDALVARSKAIAEFAADEPTEPTETVELKELRLQLAGLELIGYNQVIEEAKHKVRLQIENLTHQLRDASVVDSGNRELLIEVAGTIDFWHELEAERKRRFYQALVERVVVRNGKVERVILKV